MRYSIITINYNNKEGLKRTLSSIKCLTNKNYESIVIDGGSDDGSKDLIKKYENYFSYWVSEKDNGIYHAMNKGVSQAHGDYIIFMNSGDCFHSQDVLDAFKEYQEDILCGKVFKKDSIIPSGHHKPTITLVDLMRGSLPHQAMFIRKDFISVPLKWDTNDLL